MATAGRCGASWDPGGHKASALSNVVGSQFWSLAEARGPEPHSRAGFLDDPAVGSAPSGERCCLPPSRMRFGEREVRAGTYLILMAGKEEPAAQPRHRSASCLQVLWRPQMVNCCLKADPSCSPRRHEGLAFIPSALRAQPQGLHSAFGPLQQGALLPLQWWFGGVGNAADRQVVGTATQQDPGRPPEQQTSSDLPSTRGACLAHPRSSAPDSSMALRDLEPDDFCAMLDSAGRGGTRPGLLSV